jgi:phage I-like protein
MDTPTTRAGGDRSRDRGKLASSAAIETAGAPALFRQGVYGCALPSAAAQATDRAGGAAPEWIELLPAGEFHGRDGRGPFRLEQPDQVIAATRTLEMDVPIDYDHATDFAAPEGRPAPAAGWIRELTVRDGAIWGRVEWTARAAAAIAAHEYRYVSPVFQFDPNTGRVTRLLRAGLTNNPNLYLTAIAATDIRAARNEVQTMEEFLAKARELLALGPDATVDQITAALAQVADAGRRAEAAAHSRLVDPALYVAIGEFQEALTELNALRAERVRERAAAAVDEAMRAGKLVPAQREWAIAYCAADAKGFAAFVARQPSILGGGADASFDLAGPAREAHPRLSETELAICAQLGVNPIDYHRRRNGRADFLSLHRGPAGEDR